MKKFFLSLMVVLMMLTSCSAQRYVSQRPITQMDEVTYVLANNYPQLHTYYMEGVIRVNSVKEMYLPDGRMEYKVDYRYTRFYYRDIRDKLEIIQVYYPELYDMYVNGVITFGTVYRYVDRETGEIKLHVSYRYIYDYYYTNHPGPYGGLHIYHYGPRRYPMAPRKMQPAPPAPRPDPGHRPDVRPGGDHRPQQGGNKPDVKPNNPPRQGGGNQPSTRPNNPPRQNGGGSSVRPNNPPRQSGGSSVRQSNPPRSSGGSARSSGGSSRSSQGGGRTGGRR